MKRSLSISFVCLIIALSSLCCLVAWAADDNENQPANVTITNDGVKVKTSDSNVTITDGGVSVTKKGESSTTTETKTTGANVKAEASSGVVPEGLTKSQPIEASSNDTVTVVKRYIETDGNGVTLHGNATVTVTDSTIVVGNNGIDASGNGTLSLRKCRIVAKNFGVHVHGNGTITISDCVIQGDQGALVMSGNATINANGCKLKGAVNKSGNATFIDAGNNVFEK